MNYVNEDFNDVTEFCIVYNCRRRKLLEVPLNQSLKNRIRINRQNLIVCYFVCNV